MPKKIILIIVEGPSDSTALDAYLSDVFASNFVHIVIVYGDITTERGSTRANIRRRVAELVRRFLASAHLKPDCVSRIIHITDTDGAFIPNDCIIEDDSCRKPCYTLTAIRTANKADIEKRNRNKQLCLQELSQTRAIMKIPYGIYFMSCNLEHVLFDRLNCSNDEKEEMSYRFSHCFQKTSSFQTFLAESYFSVSGPYRTSWLFIQSGDESLKRHTHLALSWLEPPAVRTPAPEG